jgi:hypothetical protein
MKKDASAFLFLYFNSKNKDDVLDIKHEIEIRQDAIK